MASMELSTFLAAQAVGSLPDHVETKAARILADTLAAILAGAQEPETQALAASILPAGGTGRSTALGHVRQTEAGQAAFLNGTAGVFLELDEGSAASKGHPAIHIVPPLLAWAEQEGGSGEHLLHALTLGYEVATRVGAGATLRPTMHPHGVWGVVGAAVALAVYDGAGAQEIDETIRLSASMALATSRPSMTEGATIRNAYTGLSAQHAIQARRLIKAGFTGDSGALANVFGAVIGSNWEETALTSGLGARWAIEDNYFKRHACCRYNHAALDALVDLDAANPCAITPDSVEAIEIRAYTIATELDDPAPQNMLAAKFSLPFAVATTIRRAGDTWLDSFRGDALTDPVTLALSQKVSLVADKEMDKALPDHRISELTIQLKSGDVLTRRREITGGDPEQPFDAALLDDKFLRLTTPFLGVGAANQALRLTLNARALDDVRSLASAFTRRVNLEAAK